MRTSNIILILIVIANFSLDSFGDELCSNPDMASAITVFTETINSCKMELQECKNKLSLETVTTQQPTFKRSYSYKWIDIQRSFNLPANIVIGGYYSDYIPYFVARGKNSNKDLYGKMIRPSSSTDIRAYLTNDQTEFLTYEFQVSHEFYMRPLI